MVIRSPRVILMGWSTGNRFLRGPGAEKAASGWLAKINKLLEAWCTGR
jgi:hypothetical protein